MKFLCVTFICVIGTLNVGEFASEFANLVMKCSNKNDQSYILSCIRHAKLN